MKEDYSTDDLIRDHEGRRHQGFGMKLGSHGIANRRGTVHVNGLTLPNRFYGDSALRRLKCAAREIIRQQSVSLRSHEFLSRTQAPEVGAVHAKELSGRLAEQMDQSGSGSSPGRCFRESQEQFLESIVRSRAGFFQHCRISGTSGQEDTTLAPPTLQVIEYTGKIDRHLNLSQGNNVRSAEVGTS